MTEDKKHYNEFAEDFKYLHKENPYDEKLEEFSEFVLRDEEPEKLKGLWNKEIFKNEFPIILEVGTGFGNFMINYCQKFSDKNFVGLDFRFKRSFEVAKKLSALPHRNFRYLRAKGERIHFMFNESEVSEMYFLFPDPWPKKRHHKKRLFQQPFLNASHKVLKKGSRFIIKTDHDGYAEWMREEIATSVSENKFKVIFESKDLYLEHPEHELTLFQTNFEKIFISQGIKIKTFILECIK